MKKHIIVGVAAAVALVTGSAAPAFATDYTVDGTVWNINDTSNFGVSQFSADEQTAPYGAYSGDGHTLELEDPTSPGDYLGFDCSGATDTQQADGDLLLECDNPSDLLGGDLTWDATITIFSGDYRGIVGRLVYTLTNTTGSDLTLDLQFEADTEECEQGGGNIATSSGDLDTTVDDAWLLCDNDNNAIEGFAWGNNWMTSFESDDALNACDVCRFKNDGVVLPANSSTTFVFFLYSEGSTSSGNAFGDTDANIIANGTSYFDTTTLGASRLWKDLTTAENWTGVVGSYKAAEPTLPNTGVDIAGLGFAALALAGLGAVIVVRRRATKA